MIVLGALSFFAATAAGYLSNGIVIIPGATSYNGLNLVPQMGWGEQSCATSTSVRTLANNPHRQLECLRM